MSKLPLTVALVLGFLLQSPEAGAVTATPKHFLLVHGGWHGAWAWYRIETQLEARGHTVTVIDLPGHGIDTTDPGSVTLADYVARTVDILDNASMPVIVVGHSAGGIVLSSAAEARPRAVEKLVYVAAFLLQRGQTLTAILLGIAQL